MSSLRLKSVMWSTPRRKGVSKRKTSLPRPPCRKSLPPPPPMKSLRSCRRSSRGPSAENGDLVGQRPPRLKGELGKIDLRLAAGPYHLEDQGIGVGVADDLAEGLSMKLWSKVAPAAAAKTNRSMLSKKHAGEIVGPLHQDRIGSPAGDRRHFRRRLPRPRPPHWSQTQRYRCRRRRRDRPLRRRPEACHRRQRD